MGEPALYQFGPDTKLTLDLFPPDVQAEVEQLLVTTREPMTADTRERLIRAAHRGIQYRRDRIATFRAVLYQLACALHPWDPPTWHDMADCSCHPWPAATWTGPYDLGDE